MIKEILNLQKYNLNITRVVSDKSGNDSLDEAFTGDGKIINSDFLNGLDIPNAKRKGDFYEIEKNWKKTNIVSTKRLGYFKTTLFGLPNTYDLFRRR